MQGCNENNKMLQNTGTPLMRHSPSHGIGGLQKRPDIIIRPLSIAPDQWQLGAITKSGRILPICNNREHDAMWHTGRFLAIVKGWHLISTNRPLIPWQIGIDGEKFHKDVRAVPDCTQLQQLEAIPRLGAKLVDWSDHDFSDCRDIITIERTWDLMIPD